MSSFKKGGNPMPPDCAHDLNRCSLKVWGHNTFAHKGDTHDVTFSNGKKMTCTSNGRDTPRSCEMKGPN
jgi:hypothetical protein